MPSYKCESCGAALDTELEPGDREPCPVCNHVNTVPKPLLSRAASKVRRKAADVRRAREEKRRQEEARREQEEMERLREENERLRSGAGAAPDPPPSAPRAARAAAGPRGERTYYSQGGVTITSTRAVVGATTYAMANITSVSMGVVPPSRGGGIALAILGIIVLVCSGGISFEPSLSTVVTVGGLVGVGLLVLGIILAVRAKAQYVVKIGSASGESNLLSSPNQRYIRAIVDAMSNAIVDRG